MQLSTSSRGLVTQRCPAPAWGNIITLARKLLTPARSASEGSHPHQPDASAREQRCPLLTRRAGVTDFLAGVIADRSINSSSTEKPPNARHPQAANRTGSDC